MIVDGGLSNDFDTAGALVVGIGWLVVLGVAVVVLLRGAVSPKRYAANANR